MKYGETLQQRSIPLWQSCKDIFLLRKLKFGMLSGHATLDNVDYNDIKHLIKVRTTQGQGQAKAIPGSDNESKAFHAFEEELYQELRDQHQRIDLFVQSKAGEVGRRLGTYLEPRCGDVSLILLLHSSFGQANCTIGDSKLPYRPWKDTYQALGEILQAGRGRHKVSHQCEALCIKRPH